MVHSRVLEFRSHLAHFVRQARFSLFEPVGLHHPLSKENVFSGQLMRCGIGNGGMTLANPLCSCPNRTYRSSYHISSEKASLPATDLQAMALRPFGCHLTLLSLHNFSGGKVHSGRKTKDERRNKTDDRQWTIDDRYIAIHPISPFVYRLSSIVYRLSSIFLRRSVMRPARRLWEAVAPYAL